MQDILALLTTLHRARKLVKFCWIPSHVGITGNELADAAARRAASAPCTRRFPLPARDFYPAVSSFAKAQWQRGWDKLRESKLRQLKQVVSIGYRTFRLPKRCADRLGYRSVRPPKIGQFRSPCRSNHFQRKKLFHFYQVKMKVIWMFMTVSKFYMFADKLSQ